MACAIWRLATGNSYRCISKVFGVSKSSAVNICNDSNEALSALGSRFIIFPRNKQETRLAIEGFHSFTNCLLPNVVGVIDGTHVEILAPDCPSKGDYYS